LAHDLRDAHDLGFVSLKGGLLKSESVADRPLSVTRDSNVPRSGHPKFVVSSTSRILEWRHSTLLGGDLQSAIAALKAQPGKTIGVHGSISLVQSLLVAGLLDELRFIQFPAIAGQGRRLLDHPGAAHQLDLRHSRPTPTGLRHLVYTPRPLINPEKTCARCGAARSAAVGSSTAIVDVSVEQQANFLPVAPYRAFRDSAQLRDVGE
jgi:dihydrofolate reductase